MIRMVDSSSSVWTTSKSLCRFDIPRRSVRSEIHVVFDGEGERIGEYRRRLVEGHAVLLQVRGGLPVIPGEVHRRKCNTLEEAAQPLQWRPITSFREDRPSTPGERLSLRCSG